MLNGRYKASSTVGFHEPRKRGGDGYDSRSRTAGSNRLNGHKYRPSWRAIAMTLDLQQLRSGRGLVRYLKRGTLETALRSFEDRTARANIIAHSSCVSGLADRNGNKFTWPICLSHSSKLLNCSQTRQKEPTSSRQEIHHFFFHLLLLPCSW